MGVGLTVGEGEGVDCCAHKATASTKTVIKIRGIRMQVPAESDLCFITL